MRTALLVGFGLQCLCSLVFGQINPAMQNGMMNNGRFGQFGQQGFTNGMNPMMNQGFNNPMMNGGFNNPMMNQGFNNPMMNGGLNNPMMNGGFNNPMMNQGFNNFNGVNSRFGTQMGRVTVPVTGFQNQMNRGQFGMGGMGMNQGFGRAGQFGMQNGVMGGGFQQPFNSIQGKK